jgi:hypothetical protein
VTPVLGGKIGCGCCPLTPTTYPLAFEVVFQPGAGSQVRALQCCREHVDQPDGSCPARLDGMSVRMVDADAAMTGADGTKVADKYRLITTLTGHRAFPAAALPAAAHGDGDPRWKPGPAPTPTGPASPAP